MNHKDVLKLLFPVPLEGDFDADIALEGKHLDAAQTSAANLLSEMRPQSCSTTIADWERVCGLATVLTDPLQTRQLRVIAKLREEGNLSVGYYEDLAAAMGYTVSVEELLANTDDLGDEGIFRWRITVADSPLLYFRAGQSRAGEPLIEGAVADALEGLFEDLKPAHTQVIFAYA